MNYLRLGDYIYALTPGQKGKKKDYLLQQQLKSRKGIPTWDDVRKMIEREVGDQYDREMEELSYESEEEINDLVYQALDKEYPTEELYEKLREEDEYDVLTPEQRSRLDDLREEAAVELLYRQYKERYDLVTHKVRYLHGETAYRLISLPENVNPKELQGVGVYWSLNPDKVGLYDWNEEMAKARPVYWRLETEIDLEYVDFWETFMHQMNPEYGKEEEEIRFFKHAPLKVYLAEEIVGFDRSRSGPSIEHSGYYVGRAIQLDGVRRT